MIDTPNPDDLSPALGGSRFDPGNAPALGGGARLALLLEAAQSSDPEVRSRAADALADLGSDEAIQRLMTMLLDPLPDLRAQAARALGRARIAEAADPLIDALRDADERVRWNAAEALGYIGHEGAVRQLLAATQDRDQVVRERAAEALGRIGSTLPDGALRDAIAPTLLEMLRTSALIFAERLSGKIQAALLQIGDPAVPALLDALDQSPTMCETAAEVLSILCATTSDPVQREQILFALLRTAAHREPLIARCAIRSLRVAGRGVMHDPDLARRVVNALLALHAAFNQPPPLIRAISLTERMFSGVQVPPRRNDFVRPDLIMALGSIARLHAGLIPLVLPTMIDTLYDDDPEMRRATLQAIDDLVSHHPKEVDGIIPALVDRLADESRRPFSPDSSIGSAAAALLRRIGTPAALDALVKAGR